MTELEPQEDEPREPRSHFQGRAQAIVQPLIAIMDKDAELRAVLRPGQYARFEEVTGHLIAIAEGKIMTCPDIRASILECLDSMDSVQLSSALGQEFAFMLSNVLYQCSMSGLTQRVANAKGKWAGRGGTER